MTVGELKEILNLGVPDELEIILQEDQEGNYYRPLRIADDHAVWVKENKTVYSLDWDNEQARLPKVAWEAIKRLPRCLVLSP